MSGVASGVVVYPPDVRRRRNVWPRVGSPSVAARVIARNQTGRKFKTSCTEALYMPISVEQAVVRGLVRIRA
jgi:hypothetical protein